MASNSDQPLVSIGFPVYNQPDLLREALKCLTDQTYRNLEIIISDDHSPGQGTRKVIQEFMQKDPRIKYYRQEHNIGPVANHSFVYGKAKGEFFYWASEDDKWDKGFIMTGVQTLLKNPRYHAWFCTINVIDSLGRVIRELPGSSRFTSTDNKKEDIVRFLKEPEGMGKANIYHSLFLREALDATLKEYPIRKGWGTDFSFSLAFLARFNIIGTDEVLFYKRAIRRSVIDHPDFVTPIVIRNVNRYTFRPKRAFRFILEHYKAACTTPYKNLVVFTMLSRIPSSVINAIMYKLTRKAESLSRRINTAGRWLKKLVS
jgi:glycosyltransferase involved in cell wall biosynthesis